VTLPSGVRLLAGGLGLALAGTGLVSQGLTLWEPRWGSLEWEVAYFGEFSGTLSILTMGLAALVFLAVEAGRRWTVLGLAGLMVLIGVWALVGGVLVATDLPLVWEAAAAAPSPMQAAGFKLVSAKAIALCLLYAVAYLLLGAMAIRTTFARGR